MRLVYRLEAVDDVRVAYDWYQRQRSGLGEEFLVELGVVEERISTAPFASAFMHRDVRRALLRRFPYCVLYRVTGNVIDIVGCFHVRRSPRVARRR